MSAEAVLDSHLAALPRLLESLTAAHTGKAEVCGVVGVLLESDPSLFGGALLFKSVEGHGFVFVHHEGGPFAAPRTWLRWPLRRLFATRRPRIIGNPITGELALTVPLNAGMQRFVVIAPLAVSQPDAARQAFLQILQSVVTAEPAAQSPPSLAEPPANLVRRDQDAEDRRRFTTSASASLIVAKCTSNSWARSR